MNYCHLWLTFVLLHDLQTDLQTGNMPQVPGYYTKSGRFVLVKEMIPEFVVPDLKDFQVHHSFLQLSINLI